MVNDIELLDALHKGNQYVKKLHDIIAQATFAMAVEEELSKPGKANVNIFVDSGAEEEKCGICIDGLWLGNASAPEAFIKMQIDTVKEIAAKTLKNIPDLELDTPDPAFKKVEPEEDPQEEAKRQQDTKETKVAPVQQDKPAKATSSIIIPDYLLREEYFKNGKTVKAIAEEYKTGVHGLYKRIEQMKKQIEKTAKEDVRR